MKFSPKSLILAFVAGIVAIAFLILANAAHADYQQDQDIDKAAQKLSDRETAEKAEYDREHPTTYGDSSPMSAILGMIVIFGGGFFVVRFFWNAHTPR